jgi:hypothetical protein
MNDYFQKLINSNEFQGFGTRGQISQASRIHKEQEVSEASHFYEHLCVRAILYQLAQTVKTLTAFFLLSFVLSRKTFM